MKTNALGAGIEEDIQDVPTNGLMKYYNKTWLPAVEVNMQQWIDKDGNYQLKQYLHSKKFFTKQRAAIDVGANLGLFTRRMVEDFETVYSFEPLPAARACMTRNNLAANNYVLYPFGLGNGDYETEISYCEHAIGGSTIGRHADETRFVEQQIKLRIKSLDSFNFTNIDFIKVDIQGYEYEMLQGAKKTLQENSPVLLVELMADGVEHKEIPKFLKDLGYALEDKVGKDGIFVKKKPLFNLAGLKSKSKTK